MFRPSVDVVQLCLVTGPIFSHDRDVSLSRKLKRFYEYDRMERLGLTYFHTYSDELKRTSNPNIPYLLTKPP